MSNILVILMDLLKGGGGGARSRNLDAIDRIIS